MNTIQCRYDVNGLAEELEVQLSDIVMLYLNYFQEMESEISHMKSCLSKNDWSMLQRVIHNVKGVSANLNIYDVFEEASALDVLLKSGISENADKSVEKIICLIGEAEGEIKNYFSKHGLLLLELD